MTGHVVKSWFGKPRCSVCGSVVVPTGYCYPFPAYRCNNCYDKNTKQKKLEERIAELERKLNQ